MNANYRQITEKMMNETTAATDELIKRLRDKVVNVTERRFITDLRTLSAIQIYLTYLLIYYSIYAWV
jgi:hypothetical protein